MITHARPSCVEDNILQILCGSACKKKRVQVTPSLACQAPILSMPTLSAEFSYPEGVERLIGEGWREENTLCTGRIEEY